MTRTSYLKFIKLDVTLSYLFVKNSFASTNARKKIVYFDYFLDDADIIT